MQSNWQLPDMRLSDLPEGDSTLIYKNASGNLIKQLSIALQRHKNDKQEYVTKVKQVKIDFCEKASCDEFMRRANTKYLQPKEQEEPATTATAYYDTNTTSAIFNINFNFPVRFYPFLDIIMSFETTHSIDVLLHMCESFGVSDEKLAELLVDSLNEKQRIINDHTTQIETADSALHHEQQIVSSLNQQLTEKDIQIETLTNTIEKQQKAIQEVVVKIDELKTTMQKREIGIYAMKIKLDNQELAVLSQKKEIEDQRQTISSQEMRILELTTGVEKQTAQIETLTNDSTTKDKTIEEKDIAIKEQQIEIQQQVVQLDGLKIAITGKEVQIREMGAMLTNEKLTVVSQQEEMEKQQKMIEQLKNTLTEEQQTSKQQTTQIETLTTDLTKKEETIEKNNTLIKQQAERIKTLESNQQDLPSLGLLVLKFVTNNLGLLSIAPKQLSFFKPPSAQQEQEKNALAIRSQKGCSLL